MKIDLDNARDPVRFDSANWTASNGEIDRMVKWLSHVRESIPANMDLACDMHGCYAAPTGKKVAKALEPFKLMWLEEPVPPEDIDATADIRHSTSTPIACGENLYSCPKPCDFVSPGLKVLIVFNQFKKGCSQEREVNEHVKQLCQRCIRKLAHCALSLS